MIKQVFAIVILISFFGFSQIDRNIENDYIELNWKLEPNDTLVYQTIMSEIGESKFEMDFQGLFGKITDSIETKNKNFHKDFFEKLKGFYANTNLETKLSNSSDFNNVIDIRMIATPNSVDKDDDEKDRMSEMMQSMMKGTMLRGSIHKTGELHSFWVKGSQKNLLSLFFELPNQPLKIGETWTLDNVNFIGNDQNFICREARKKNVITLKEINQVNGDSIALIDYDILEYVSGNFNSPAFFNKESSQQKTIMKFIYKAQEEVSIKKGKWISYNGIMSLDSNGAIKSTQRQKFALIEK